MGNKSLNNAKAAKHDEFYTQLTDIEKELQALPVKQYYESPMSIWFEEDFFQEKQIIHVPL